MDQTVNLLSYDFGGSNPPPPTTSKTYADSRQGDANFFSAALPYAAQHAEVAQLVEHQPSKLRVASSNLVFRSNADVAQW